MANTFAALAGIVVFGTFCCAWRAWRLFRTYRPAVSVVIESSYTERMQDADAPFGNGWYTHGKPGVRFVRDEVRFEDAGGHRRTACVSHWVARRYRPDHSYIVWYDPADAARVTAIGPSYWLGFGAVMVMILIGASVMVAQIQRQISLRSEAAQAGQTQAPR